MCSINNTYKLVTKIIVFRAFLLHPNSKWCWVLYVQLLSVVAKLKKKIFNLKIIIKCKRIFMKKKITSRILCAECNIKCVCVCNVFMYSLFFLRGGIYLLAICYFLSVYIYINIYVNKHTHIYICILDFMHIDFPFTPCFVFQRENAPTVRVGWAISEVAGEIFFSKLCDIIIPRFPGVKSNAQTQHFAGGVRSPPTRVFSF